jgi:hypothetical protein
MLLQEFDAREFYGRYDTEGSCIDTDRISMIPMPLGVFLPDKAIGTHEFLRATTGRIRYRQICRLGGVVAPAAAHCPSHGNEQLSRCRPA